jgi:hypothetical protein
MDKFNDDDVRHRSKSKRQNPKKSDHKHDYVLVEKEQWSISNWFTCKYVCTICGKEYEKVEIES